MRLILLLWNQVTIMTASSVMMKMGLMWLTGLMKVMTKILILLLKLPKTLTTTLLLIQNLLQQNVKKQTGPLRKRSQMKSKQNQLPLKLHQIHFFQMMSPLIQWLIKEMIRLALMTMFLIQWLLKETIRLALMMILLTPWLIWEMIHSALMMKCQTLWLLKEPIRLVQMMRQLPIHL
mgnify:CR=1 FL=1